MEPELLDMVIWDVGYIQVSDINMTKTIYTSWTIWFNVLTVLTVLASKYGYIPDPATQEVVGQMIVALSPLVNIALRFKTKHPVTL